MMTDLVKRLRERSCQYVDNEYNFDKRAADRIEALEAALRELAETDLTGIAIKALDGKDD